MPVGRLMNEFQTIRQLLEGAERLANESGEALPGPEHLLLSALALPDGTARQAFERLGADPDGLEAAIAGQHADALRAVGIQVDGDGPVVPAPEPRGVFHSMPSAQAAFRRAVELSKASKPRRLLGAHVVLAITETGRGTMVRALDRMGVNREELAAAAREELAPAVG
ncbi:MAG: Clp protease N-terminal domain-containing protein [Chloroflexota bacterium]